MTSTSLWYLQNRESQIAKAKARYRENPAACNARNKRHREEHPDYHCARGMVRGARERAVRKGIDFDPKIMTVGAVQKRLASNPICSCCRGPLHVGPKGKIGPVPGSPTIDRIDTARGYVKGNVAIICHRCNRLKSDATADELQRIVDWMRANA